MSKDLEKRDVPKPYSVRQRPITEQERAACLYRITPECKSHKDAILHAYPKAKNWDSCTVAQYAHQVFKRPQVREYLEKLYDQASKRAIVDAEAVVDGFNDLARANLTDLVSYTKKRGPNGEEIFVLKMGDFEEVPAHVRRAIKKLRITTKPVKNEEGETDHVVQDIEVEMYDKQRALDSLARYFKLYNEVLEIHHTGTVQHSHSTSEMRTLFESMTQEERAEHLHRLIRKAKGEDVIDVDGGDVSPEPAGISENTPHDPETPAKSTQNNLADDDTDWM